jgi:excisionase family DNA binding protein
MARIPQTGCSLDDLPEFLTPEELAVAFRTGRSATYDAIRRGDFPHIKVGRLIRVPKHVVLEAAGRMA